MTTAIIGAGAMGGTLLAGLVAAGWDRSGLVVGEQHPQRRAEIAERYGVRATSAVDAATGADLVAVVVKPADVLAVLSELAGVLAPGAVVVSLAAGLRCAQLECVLPPGTPVVRVMPNTPAQVGAGMAAISPGSHATAEHLDEVSRLMSAVGAVVTVPEADQDAVTAVSGSGPAYALLVAEAMTDAGVAMGLRREVAALLAAQTLAGSAKLLLESGEHPAVLRAQVTSPGGTTAAALRQLEAHGLREAFAAAMLACRDRSIEMGQ